MTRRRVVGISVMLSRHQVDRGSDGDDMLLEVKVRNVAAREERDGDQAD